MSPGLWLNEALKTSLYLDYIQNIWTVCNKIQRFMCVEKRISPQTQDSKHHLETAPPPSNKSSQRGEHQRMCEGFAAKHTRESQCFHNASTAILNIVIRGVTIPAVIHQQPQSSLSNSTGQLSHASQSC